MEYCPSVGFESTMHELQFDAYFTSKVDAAHDFMPDLNVGQFMPVVIEYMTLLFYRQRTKSLVITSVFFDNFFKATLVFPCLIL